MDARRPGLRAFLAHSLRGLCDQSQVCLWPTLFFRHALAWQTRTSSFHGDVSPPSLLLKVFPHSQVLLQVESLQTAFRFRDLPSGLFFKIESVGFSSPVSLGERGSLDGLPFIILVWV